MHPNPMNTEETKSALNREIVQARLYYFHCMDFRLYDLAEQTLKRIETLTLAFNSLS